MKAVAIQILTHIGDLFEVPIAMVVNDGILSMAIIHLTCLRRQLVKFWPYMFGSLCVKMTSEELVCAGVQVNAILFVVMYVDEGD